MGFRTSSCDESLFLKGEGEKLVLFLVYVDDILLFSSSMKEIQKVQQQLMKNFKCKTLGEVKYYLGMHVERDLDHRWLKLHQEKFIKELGEKYGIENERKVATPLPAEFKLVKAAEDEGVEAEEQQQFQSLVGSLLYAAVHTRPDISFSVGQLARVVQNPSEEQVDAAERVVKYLNSHPSIGVQYSASAQVKQKGVEVLKEKGELLGEGKLFLTCFTDATWASEKDDSSSGAKARSQLNPIDGLHDTLRDVQGTLAVLTKSLLIPLSTNSDPRIGAGLIGADGALEQFKSRLVAKGFQQKEKADFGEIFAPVVKPVTLRTVLASVAVEGWHVKQMDITTVFLNGMLLEDIYMAQPDGYEDGTSRVCKLKKAIYGLKQAPRCWYEKLEEVLLSGGFKTSQADHSLFLLGEGEQLLLLLVFVDDILLFSPSMEQIERTQKLLMDNFKCKMLGD
ncbi:unnamed protein product, partial [Closterium sp. NIES-53]